MTRLALADRPRMMVMADAQTHCAHLVTDDAAVAGRADGGRYLALCGAVVLAASLTMPETSYCALCAYHRRYRSQGVPG